MGSHAQEISDAMEMFGYTLFLFLIAVKMDMGMLQRVGRKSWAIGVTSLIAPILVATATLTAYSRMHKPAKKDFEELSFISIEQSLTSFPVISCLLSDLKLSNTELGRLALSSSLVSNILGILLVFSTSTTRMAPSRAFRDILLTIIFLLMTVFVLRAAMKWIVRHTPEGRPVKEIYLQGILFLAISSALYSNFAGQTILLGPLLLGLAVPDGPPLGSALVNRLESFFTGILLPVYVTSTVANTDLDVLVLEIKRIPIEAAVIFIVFVAKMVGSILPPLICKMPFNDSLALAAILSCKGVVELGTYRFLHGQEGLADRIYSLAIVSVFISATLTPILVRWLFDSSRKYGGYQTRDVMHLKPDMELPVVTCIHTPDNISSVIGMLGCLSPAAESPIAVNAIHLVKLVGQATPVLISHQQQKRIESKSYSEDMILAFTNYARNNMGAVHVNLFTAISPAKLMHEDVCYIALDKLTSLIILPFHCKWSCVDGELESEDSAVRAMNMAVLQRAPCSAAILVDRGNLGQAATKPHFQVGMFYIGGDDDREALALAKRMARGPGLVLTVVHLCEEEGGRSIRLDEVMEDEVLRDVRENAAGPNVMYKREVVRDGPQSALLIRSMVDEFDLIMVGRRYGMECTQTSGLGDWNEVDELGVLGDLLASADLHTDASLLVVQRQQRH
ncbi:cation/H(+) antiporter 4-like [Punica granatum]|nr:cation/H(+) antiporter 4-like [Punica granatum]